MHSWKENWNILSTYFDYSVEIRKIIYTTNAIEGLNRQFRKVTKTKNVFPNDDSLRKMLYLAIQNLNSRWTQRCRNWDLIINQLRIMDSSEEWYVIKNEKKAGMKSTPWSYRLKGRGQRSGELHSTFTGQTCRILLTHDWSHSPFDFHESPFRRRLSGKIQLKPIEKVLLNWVNIYNLVFFLISPPPISS